MKNIKTILMIGLGLIAGWFAIKILLFLFAGVVFVAKVAIPLLVVAGIVYVVYRLSSNQKSIGGNRRFLP